MTIVKNTSVLDDALNSTTIQDFLAHSTDLTSKVFGFPRDATNFEYYSPQQIGRWAEGAKQAYCEAGLPCEKTELPLVVGLRATSSIAWVVSFLTLARLGHTILLLSPTLSIEALGALLSKAECDIFVDGSSDISDLECPGKTIIPLASIAELDERYRTLELGDSGKSSNDYLRISEDDVAVIVHSSGSTGLPKLIHKTHRELLTRLRGIPPILHDKSFFVGSWLYYMVGLYSMLFSFIKPGGPSHWANEKLTLGPEELKGVLTEAKPQVAWLNTYFIFKISSDEKGIELLKNCIMVINSGEVLPEHLGNKLVKAGVRLGNEYGMSELSLGLSSVPSRWGDHDWNYLQPDPSSAPHLEFQPLPKGSKWAGGEQLYELVVLPSHPIQNKKWANSPDGSFHTGDVFIKHPKKPRYKCMGRMCDEIEICHDQYCVGVNAIDYEHRLMGGNEDIIDAAVLFGKDRPEAGALLFARPGSAVSTGDILERVWATIEQQINGVLPVGLAKKMVVVLRDAVIPRTSKGNVVRLEVYSKYEKVIDDAYGLINELGVNC